MNRTELSEVKQALLDIKLARKRIAELEARESEPIAVIGAGLRFPGGCDDPISYWRLLERGGDAVREIPQERWDLDRYWDPDPDQPARMNARHAALLSSIDRFDADFFGISRREAESMDPQQRIALEVAWEALENAAVNPDGLVGSATGVFLGMSNCDYGRMVFSKEERIDAYSSTGTLLNVAAGRISYFFGFAGPSVVVDTACSGSLTAIHLACQSLRAGECRTALAGGVSLIASPGVHINFSKARMLSADGRCKAFDARADGFVRGEGCGIVVLKRLSDAGADGDRVLGLIRASAVNQDGRTNGLTAPNGPSQEAVIRQALGKARLPGHEIGYVEAHGTGTALGDPIEAHALAAALGGRDSSNPLVVGSVKTNIGHLEAAAGVAGLIKTLLLLEHEWIPPHLNFERLNPHIDWSGTPIEIPVEGRAWKRGDRKRIAGVSSFGFSGTNAHVIVEEAPVVERRTPEQRQPRLLTITARSQKALDELAERFAAHLEASTEDLADICYTANQGRAQLRHRLSVVASSKLEMAAALRSKAFARPEELENLAAESLDGAERRRKVALPAYPFERESYWIEDPATQPDSQRVWNSAQRRAAEQSRQGPLDLDVSRYAELWRDLETLSRAYIARALASAGEVQEKYRRLLRRWTSALDQAAPPDARELDALVTALRGKHGRAEVFLEYVIDCGERLPAIVTGAMSALETLFPDGSFTRAEQLYEHSPLSQYFSAIARAAVEGWISAGPGSRARILEVGAGTGGTTSAILPVLDGLGAQYFFTDVSDLFLRRAAQKYARFPFVRYARLDLEQPLEGQGFAEGQFDVAIATNVLHATRDLRRTVTAMRSLLAPGGMLVVCEATDYLPWFDMTTGLIEGWQAFDDSLRHDHPLLAAREWEALLRSSGFEDVGVYPADGAPAVVLGQRVFLALAPRRSSGAKRAIPLRAESSPTRIAVDSAADGMDVRQIVVRQVADVLGADPARLDLQRRMTELGVDSLMALELRKRLESALQLDGRLTATIAFDYPNVEALILFLEREANVSPSQAPPQPASEDEDFGLSERLRRLSEMSDAEAERMLLEQLGTL